ncbi:hypothetical protein B0J17DRAFT_160810 [Rhizoctonia solani]|nr:hypothetical protein B0J17DRAFT_160810 [Rhizoctonia solani]
MFSRWKALLTLVMGAFDRLRSPELHASSRLSIIDVDSGDIQPILQVNLADLYGFPVGFGTSRTLASPFQETGQAHLLMNMGEHIFRVAEAHDCSENCSDHEFSMIFNDARPAFGQHSPRLEEEIARWLALLHEIGIVFTVMRALSKGKGFEKHTNPAIGESIYGLIGFISPQTIWENILLIRDGIHMDRTKPAPQFCTHPPFVPYAVLLRMQDCLGGVKLKLEANTARWSRAAV